MTPKRPALSEVLAALTADGDPRFAEFWRVAVRPYEPPAKITKRVDVTDKGVATFDVIDGLDPLRCVALQRWAHASPADALAALVEARLIPEHWLDPERAPRWWWGECSVCGGNPRVSDEHGFVTRETCFACDDDGYHTPTPPSLPAVVAVASLGADTLARAEEHARQSWRARVVWRVASGKAIRDGHRDVLDHTSAEDPARVVSATAALYPKDADAARRWAEGAGLPPKTGDAVVDLLSLGLHLVAVDDRRAVTLAVEAL